VSQAFGASPGTLEPLLSGAGFSRRHLDKAPADGRVVRIRRGVHSLPAEAGVLRFALENNALLTCLSAAPTHRLWTLQEVETDGSTHVEPRQVQKDRKRNNATVIGGRLCLRFGYDDVVYHPERMVAQVLEVLELCRRGAFGTR